MKRIAKAGWLLLLLGLSTWISPWLAWAEDVIYINDVLDYNTDPDILYRFSFEGDFQDSVNLDTYTESYGTDEYTAGISEQCRSFSGMGDYAITGRSYRLGDAWTVNFWLKLKSYSYGTLLCDDAMKIEFGGEYVSTNLYITLTDRDGGERGETLSDIIKKDEWTMVTLTYDPAHLRFSVYLDGSFLISYRRNLLAKSDDPLLIGAASEEGDDCFIGYLDELCAWKRCFSEREVKELYDGFEIEE